MLLFALLKFHLAMMEVQSKILREINFPLLLNKIKSAVNKIFKFFNKILKNLSYITKLITIWWYIYPV